ncbi:MAG: aminotransferase class I/II-fold pyridoxal phosphate-dependent enzyme [Methanosarcinales archaeon]|nr:aminotransferase class I/II-fold pyridoxal phosphate-dependent enzyme [Methanosarcinales archaeon]
MTSNRRFAKRVEKIDISGIRKLFEGAGPNAINMGLGQPDFDTPDHIKQAAIDAINDGFTGYTTNLGVPELRQALSVKFEQFNKFQVASDDIIITSGASEALHIALLALVEQGDEVLVPDPGFVSYVALTDLSGGRAVGVPLNDTFNLDAETVAEYVTDKTRVLVINSPSNPTGGVQTTDEIQGLCELADDHNITIISDEVYEHIIYEGEHVSPASISNNVVTINATSKTYAMTGWRLGYVAAPHDITEQMLKVHQYVQACANSIAQKAALAAITGPQECVAEMRESFMRRRDILMKGLKDLGIECVEPKGAFYAFPKVDNSMEAVMKLLDAGVITAPGSAFGPGGEGHIRLSYATSDEDILQALDIMGQVL